MVLDQLLYKLDLTSHCACVYDNPPPPTNLICQPMSGGVVEISWSPVPQDCTMSSVDYMINIRSIGGNSTVEQGTICSTSVQFSLTPGEEYVATLTTVAIDTVRSTIRVSESTNCTFMIEEFVHDITTAVLPTTSSNTDTSHTAEKTELDTTTAVVITFVVTTVITLIVGVVFGSLATFLIMKKRKSTPEHHSPTDGASGGPFYEQVSPSNATSKGEVEMDKNVAYGHVQQRR